MKSNVIIIHLLIFLFLACTGKFSKDNKIIAKIGNHSISESDFMSTYELSPYNAIQGKNSKLRLLNAMINEILLFEMILNEQSLTWNSTDPRLQLIKEEYLVERMFKKHVNDKIEIDENEILESIINSKNQYRVNYLFSQDIETLKACMNLLIDGAEFEELPNLFSDPELLYTGKSTYFNIGEIDGPLQKTILSLSLGEVSQIVESQFGYYIFQIDDIVSRSISDIDIKRNHERHKKIVWNKKSNILAREFLDTMLTPKNIVVKSEVFSLLVNELYPYYKNNTLYDIPLIKYIEDHKKDFWLRDTLVTYNEGGIEVNEIISYLSKRPIYFSSTSLNHFAIILEKQLAIIIRDYFIIDAAVDNGFHNDFSLEKEMYRWQKNIFVNDYISSISNNEFAMIYEERSNLSKSAIRDRALESAENIINSKLDSLKKVVNVSINDEMLSNLDGAYDSTAQLIEVRFFKLGLPYLRSAVPYPNKILIGDQ